MLPLADRSLNKITFKFNCKCILSVGFAAAAAVVVAALAAAAAAAGAVNCNHVAHFSLAGRGPISSPQPRDAGLLQSNVIIFAIYTFSCFCCFAFAAATSCLAYFRLCHKRPRPRTWSLQRGIVHITRTKRGGIRDRVIKVNLAAIYRHICFAVAVAAAAVASASAATSVARRPAQRSCRHLLLPLVQLN